MNISRAYVSERSSDQPPHLPAYLQWFGSGDGWLTIHQWCALIEADVQHYREVQPLRARQALCALTPALFHRHSRQSHQPPVTANP